MVAVHMSVGIEWLVDASGCSPERLQDVAAVVALLERVIVDLELCVVGDGSVHQFPGPGGVTALYLLTESHLACHTYPELGVATFNLYCCRARPPFAWREELAARLGARDVVVRSHTRGTGAMLHDVREGAAE
jgi:S-adenosylmethionine decarboxylase